MLTYDQMIALNDTTALYEIEYRDGVGIGCGTQEEIITLQGEGVFNVKAVDLRMRKIA